MRFLFVDRIVQLSPGEWIKGIKHVTGDDAYLTIDDQGRHCFMPSLIGETLGQLAAWNVMQHNQFTSRPVAGVVSSARLYRPAYVGETLLLESNIDALDERAVQYHSIAKVGNDIIFTIDGALGPMLPMTDFISTGAVIQQFAEIYRPGDWSSIVDMNLPVLKEESCFNYGAINSSMQFDRILACEPGISLMAEKRITRSASYFPDHFPNKPVLPMTVLLECKLNLAKEFIARAKYDRPYQISELRKIKMNEFVHPGDVVVCQVKVKEQTDDELILSYRCEVDGKRVCVVDIVLIPKGK
ncbi:3-hydroxyacyl-ACP dehydratase FabZ family protein [Legionella pneumophila]|uniref:3-hydroxyacyl-ACP dehydratase FabZ family protein n=1 Tax=Legionella pneumophila TaxID=446 RepID=UPI00048E7779|nr:hydroxymyristoyl-ACP dehydratase [Legionella pneumophila]HAT1821548.1 hydroxymyristoyl-ACP dehydratase [Legionella pneumophila]HAT1868287.1 hydroxymyristoyl-ACP dehydratase [Legionella pneumophila]HAT1908414.1 hydroxymyristoyl-ACP dehydratase [Legionella pneumophila]HAT1917467.1 hydroxymyristoyl-ACP dehydratase [Legionella pneumophila]HAT1923267.1 hydroxymyristoyl-ACP dehydratase [Legionella pneumophila]